MSGCSSCATKKPGALPGGCKNNGWCSNGGCGAMLDVHDWLSNVYYVDEVVRHTFVEVKFKGTRKEYYKNPADLQLEIGDAVVVESSSSGWDLGYISLTGPLVPIQMKKQNLTSDSPGIRKIVRIATSSDLEKFTQAKALEADTQAESRRIALRLKLVMKISDVEYQGDKTKATFFYTADGRVDFRELIKEYARVFRVKIEMRQVGMRQEAARLGGIGSCGRELCCSTWLTDFHSVPTSAARYQNLFLNPLKLSGQCGRLKCCLNYELDTYLEALEEFPNDNIKLKTAKGNARVEKLDVLKRIMWFKYEDPMEQGFFALSVDAVKEILALNADGKVAESLDDFTVDEVIDIDEKDYKDTVGEERLDRFDRKPKKKKNKNPNNRGGAPLGNPNANRNNPNQGNKPNPAPVQQGNNPNRNPQQGNNPNQNRNNPNPNRNLQQGNNPNPNRNPQQTNNPNPNRNNPQGGNPNPNRNNPNPNQRNPNQNRNNPNQQGGNRPNNPQAPKQPEPPKE